MTSQATELTSLRNIGQTVAARLLKIGITTRVDLSRIGAPEIYRRLVAQNDGSSLPVCYYLYSIQGAIDDVHWDEIGDPMKQRLLIAIGRGST